MSHSISLPRICLLCACRTSVISSTRSKLGRDEIKWAELLSHFRSVQNKHEKSRRQALGADDYDPPAEFAPGSSGGPSNGSTNGTNSANRPPMRRRVTGTETNGRLPPRALSPLNPRARQSGLSTAMASHAVPMSPTFAPQKLDKAPGPSAASKRTLSVNRNGK